MTVLAGGAGLFLARALGATNRGQFAAIQSWSSILTVIGEFGLTASICFHIARHPGRAADWLATSVAVILAFGIVTATVASALGRPLASATGAPLRGFLLAFIALPVMFAGGAWIFALQATDTKRWNLARLVNPIAYAIGIGVFGALHRLTVLGATEVLVGAMVLQAAIGYRFTRAIASGGRRRLELVSPLLRYAASSLAGTVPFAFNARIDQVLLTLLVSNAALGNYAVAVSLTMLASPMSTAFGYVIMPLLARSERDKHEGLVRTAVAGSIGIGVLVMTIVAVATWLLAVRVLGPTYRDVPVLVLMLAPGAVLLGCNQVLGDILRGRDRPLDVARCEAVGLITTAVLLLSLVPHLAARGAALASTAAYLTSFTLLIRRVRTETRGAGDGPLYESLPAGLKEDRNAGENT